MRALLFALVLAAGTAAPAAAQLYADLSAHIVFITSSYVGQDLVLFGAREGEGDVIVVLRGPVQDQVVRKKDRVLGLWLNRDQVVLQGLPAYYAVAASAPLESIASVAFLTSNQIGAERLNFAAVDADSPQQATEFGRAFVRLQQAAGLYAKNPEPVHFVGGPLFRAEVHLPAAAPVGAYTATTYLVRDGVLAGTASSALFVSKTGVERAIYDFAHARPAAYGILAVMVALSAGWIVTLVLRRA